MSFENLSFPFRLYPSGIAGMSSYVESDTYIEEVIKLFQFITKLKDSIDNKNLNIFIIGSLLDDNPEHFKKHINQHLPLFLLNFIRLNKDININIIVISPSKAGNDPIFITKSTILYKWDRISANGYKSNKYPNLNYNFFNCPIPEYIEEDFKLSTDVITLKGTTKQLPKHYFRKRLIRKLFNFMDNEFEFKDIKLLDPDMVSILKQYKKTIMNSLTNRIDIQFVKDFYKILSELINKTIINKGGNLCLNYAVFRDSWAGVSSFYFMNTFYNLFKDNISILTYNFQSPPISQLIDVTDKIYSYNDLTIILHLISSPKYISILDKSKQSKYKVHSTKKYINVNSKHFLIKNVPADGNCMFNAILKQIQHQISIEELRHRTVEYILSNPILLSEIMTNIEGEGIYNQLIHKMRNEGKSEFDIKHILQDIYFTFMRSTPDNPQSESYRQKLGLPLQVYYGGTVELKAIVDIMSLNISVIEGDEDNIIITDYETSNSNKKIYLRSVGLHINIAELQDHTL